jgi:hypothetical protein
MANQANKQAVEQAAAPVANAPSITIDGVTYPVEGLSNNAKSLVDSLRMTDREIKQLEQKLVIARIAQQALGNALRADVTALAA